MLAQLAHPNVVAACDAREPGGLLYFVMEFVDGMSFADFGEATFLVRATYVRRGSYLKECWVMQITWDCSRRSLVPPGNIWASFRRRLRM